MYTVYVFKLKVHIVLLGQKLKHTEEMHEICMHLIESTTMYMYIHIWRVTPYVTYIELELQHGL